MEIKFILNREICIGADACGGVCARICPPDIIEYVKKTEKKIPRVTEPELCMKDHGCQNNCPVQAITILPPQGEGRDF